jgi:hypothetical protein
MLPLAISFCVRLRSFLIVFDRRGENAYLEALLARWSHRRRENHLPGPEGNQESKPRECEDPSILVVRVEDRDRPRLLSDGIDLWGLPEGSDANHIGYWMYEVLNKTVEEKAMRN